MPPVAFRNPFERTSQPHTVDRNPSAAFLVVAVIPARYASTRLPGKPLADIAGRPMIEHVYRRAAEAHGVDAVVVATDDERIARAVEQFGGIVRMTQPGHRTGTDRIAEIARELPCEIIVNVQGDVPLIDPHVISDVVEALAADPALQMSTVCQPITDEREYANPNVVKVVRNRSGDALFFSRASIPHRRVNGPAEAAPYKHIGLYGYRRDFLLHLATLPQTPLERSESLEQLRALEHGFRIRVVETQYESVEVDTPEDLERVRRLLAVPARA